MRAQGSRQLAWLVSVLLFVGTVVFPATCISVADEDPVVQLNQMFRGFYRATKAAYRMEDGPLIIVRGGFLTFLHHGKTEEAEVLPKLFEDLKAYSHIPLALYVLLKKSADSSDTLPSKELQSYRVLLEKARGEIPNRGFSKEQSACIENIVATSSALLADVLRASGISKSALELFAKKVAPLVLSNAKDSAKLFIDGLDTNTERWRGLMTKDEWARLRVVVSGTHMIRDGSLAMQYYAKKLPPPVDDRKLIFAESRFEDAQILDLVGTVAIDTDIGSVFFGDPLRMHRDLLSDAAMELLSQ